MDPIEETIEGIPISKIFDIIFANFELFKDGDNRLNFKNIKGKLPDTLINELIVVKNDFYSNIKYKNENIPQEPKLFEFKGKNGIKKYYRIYTKKYFESILKKYEIINPVVIFNNRVSKLNFDELTKNAGLKGWNYSFYKIVEEKVIDYKKLVFDDIEIEKQKTGKYYTKNFNLYFENQKEEEFVFNFSKERSLIYRNLIDDNSQIKCYCGPHGIGKTTTFLVFKKTIENFCYFNLKHLFKNSDNLLIWKNELILLEIAETFKSISNYDKFLELVKEIESTTKIWESIISIFKFVIKNNIKISFILDQYKQKLDNDYCNIKEIISLIEKDTNRNASLLLLSSINDKDVRMSLLELWFGNDKDKKQLTLTYIYIPILLDAKNIIDKDTSLSIQKKNLISQDFNNIPKYYYRIKNIEDENLEKFKCEEKNHIKNKINEFFNDFCISCDDIIFLIQHVYQSGISSNLEKNTFERLVRLIPFKYFIIDNVACSINYRFPFVENIFKSVLMENSAFLLKNPLPAFKPSVIGDILEFNLINDLSLNKVYKCDSVCQIDSFYTLKYSSYINLENIKTNTILFTQLNTNAKNFDFGILYKGEDLILFQCKKALMKKPDEYVKYEDLMIDKHILAQNFKEKYKINIKKIYLLYITGITFYIKNGKKLYKTWVLNKKENFKILEKICKNSQCELLYYDVNQKRLYIKKDEKTLEAINDLIYYIKQLKYYETLEDESKELNDADDNFMNTTLMSVIENIKNTKKYKEKQDILSLNEKKMLSN